MNHHTPQRIHLALSKAEGFPVVTYLAAYQVAMLEKFEGVEHCRRVAEGICALLHAETCDGCELHGCAGARALWTHLNLCEGCSSPVCTKAKALLHHYDTCASRKRLRENSEGGSKEGTDGSGEDAPAPICLVCALVERERSHAAAPSKRLRVTKRVRFAERVQEHVFCDCHRVCDCRVCDDTRPHRDVRRRLIHGF